MKSSLLIVIVLTLLPLSARGQYTCSPVERSGFTGGSISLQHTQNIGPDTIGNAEGYWTGACGQTGSIPNFFVDGQYADVQIPVYYHSGVGPACGATTWIQYPGSPEQRPILIDLYEQGPNENNQIVACNPTDSLAHEIGHVLGLGHAPSDACRGEIMGRPFPGQTRSVMSGDCATADADWYTTQENLRDHPPEPPPPPPNPNGGRSDGCGDDCSPIIINFESGGYRLTGANAPVRFRMNPRSEPTLIGWTEAGADEAFLWLDRNHNGAVTSGAELFGNFTPLRSGGYAKNGFEALQELDSNNDGLIDARDLAWSLLQLWRDLNHNGISEPSEVAPLAGSGVITIDLHDHWSGRRDRWGNAFRYESMVTIRTPSDHAARREPVYDIFFVSVGQ
jgi:hypothetical protein